MTNFDKNSNQVSAVFNHIEANPGTTVKALGSIVSSKKELVSILNGLFAEGYVVPQMDARCTVMLYAVKALAPVEPEQEVSVQANDTIVEVEPVTVTEADEEAFRTAFEKLDKGRLFVPVTELRKELSQWSREKFDEVLRTLRKNRKIQLHQSERSSMTEQEWADTYIDENGFHMRRVTWYAVREKAA